MLRQNEIAQANPKFWLAVLTAVYAKKKAIVIIAPITIVYL
jgi:hypothetical protein